MNLLNRWVRSSTFVVGVLLAWHPLPLCGDVSADESATGTAAAAVLVGAAVVDITPDFPVRLTGYGNRTDEATEVAAKIHARALVFGGPELVDGTSQALPNGQHGVTTCQQQPLAILMTVDNCGVPASVVETVFAKVAARQNVSRERFAISSTHTHSGPWLRGFAPNIFASIPDEHAARLQRYENQLVQRLVEVVQLAIDARRPGNLSLAFGELGFAMNRRTLTNGQWTGFGEVPDAPTDKRFPLLVAHDINGRLIAVLGNYACHATTETGSFNQISGDWPGFAADMIEADLRSAGNDNAVALIAIGCAADANPSPRGTHEQARQHGRSVADEVQRLLQNKLRRIEPGIKCNMLLVDLPLGPVPSRDQLEISKQDNGVEGSRARYFLQMLDEGKEIPTTVPNYPVQTWCFGEDLAMVFLGGEVVIDYSIRMNDMFDGDRLWINAYSNDVPCYIASKRILREGGYEADSSMIYYARPTRLAPEAEDLICDAVQKLLPHHFYSKELQASFPAPKSPEESLAAITVRPGLRAELVAAEPLINDPVAFDWDIHGRLWVVEMGGYPGTPRQAVGVHKRDNVGVSLRETQSPAPRTSAIRTKNIDAQATGENHHSESDDDIQAHHSQSDGYTGRVRVLEDIDDDGCYDKAVTFLDGLSFPTGLHPWRNGWLITCAPDIIYAEDTNGDLVADKQTVLYTGFTEGNQQHRINGLRWGLDGWLYLANGDSGGDVRAVGSVLDQRTEISDTPINIRGRDVRIHPDTGAIETISGQSQFGRERDDFGNWFGNNNSNPIWHYVLEDRYLKRNPFATGLATKAAVAEVPGAAPVYPTSKTLARFNDFHTANRFTSACSTAIYRDNLLGEEFYGNAFTCEPVHNLVSRLVLERDGATFKGRRAADEQTSEFFASSDNWTRPVMVRTGPDGALYIADMYRQVIEHPEWIPAEYQRKMDLYAGNNMGRIYRVVSSRLDGRGRGDTVEVGESIRRDRRLSDDAASCCGGSDEVAANVAVTLRVTTGADEVIDQQHPSSEHVASEFSGSARTGEAVSSTRPNAALPHHSESDDYIAVTLRVTTRADEVVEKQPASTELSAPEQHATENDVAPATPSAIHDSFLKQDWQDIPLAELLQLFERSNGWWRDTAQRILWHRRHELYTFEIPDPLLPFDVDGLTDDFKQKPSLYKLSVASTFCETMKFGGRRLETNYMAGLTCLFFRELLADPDPRLRRSTIQLLEHVISAGNDEVFDQYLKPLAIDEDSAVRMQLMLSLGFCGHNKAAEVLGQMLRDNFSDLNLRNAGLSSLTYANISQVITKALDGPPDEWNDQLVSLLLIQASEFHLRPGDSSPPFQKRDDLLSEPLELFLRASMKDASVSRLQLVAKALHTIAERHAHFLKSHAGLQPALDDLRAIATTIAFDKTANAEQRAAALECLGIISRIRDVKLTNLAEFIDVQVPEQLQTTALRMMASSASPEQTSAMLRRWKSYSPSIRTELINSILQQPNGAPRFLQAIESAGLSATDFDAVIRERLLNHRDSAVRDAAMRILGVTTPSARATLVQDMKSEISNLKSDATAGKVVFEKRCATCHKIGDVGKQIGADLAALKDRSTDALLTAILDPNRAVESKFLSYTAVTTSGRNFSGMLLEETGNSLTLLGTDGKQQVVARTDLEELVCSNRSLMPEGLEKDLSVEDLANVIAFVQSSGTSWKRFEGNQPQLITASADGSILLPASAAEIYGPSLVFEQKYGNLGWWNSAEDYAVWTVNVPRSGHWTVSLIYACDDGAAGDVIRFSTGTRLLSAAVPGTGSWDDYREWTVGELDLHGGQRQILVTAPQSPRSALIDLKAVRLMPPK